MSELERIVSATREEVAQRRRELPAAVLEREATERVDTGHPFADALGRPGLSLIAEHKRRSPSAGVIRADLSLEEVVGAYERGGAAALSVLTENANFGGSLDDLRRARAATDLPVLRKDFIVDPYQVDEAVVAGADAILLIAAALEDGRLSELHAQASERGLSALVEVHDSGELERAVACGARIIGVNNRNLATLEVDTNLTFELLPEIPDGVLSVAESGFNRAGQIAQLREAGANAVLVGEALMRAEDIEAACRALFRSS